MLWLPALAGDGQRGSRLPLADASAGALLEALLAAPGARQALARAIASDEHLSAWIRNSAGEALAACAGSEDLADWFLLAGGERLLEAGGVLVEGDDLSLSRDAQLLRAVCVRLEELSQRRREFDQQLERAKLEALAEFAAGAGHEMNNPLAVISGRAQLMLRELQGAERRRDLAVINSQALRVHEMIADLMLFARPPAVERQTIDVADLLPRVLNSQHALAVERGVTVRSEMPPESLEMRVDPVQLEVAWSAICRNAIEASARNQTVILGAQRSDGQVQLWVRDQGAGMPEDALRHACEPYYSGRAAGRGLGLGLSKAWRIVTQHGGQLLIDSAPQRGTCVTLMLPLGD